ncbi:MAG: hypothetical protein GXO49_06885, partial [Chlorobi bacterium]|nr:hypothetical protein [Chlorobiota bacterium]
ELTVLNDENNPAEIIGEPLYKNKKTLNKNIQSESDFVIVPDYVDEQENLPLVLPNNRFTRNWVYTTEGIHWNENYQVPYKNENYKNQSESVLPVLNDIYPWLSVGNFLEDKIFKVPYKLDNNKFNFGGSDNFMLPLTETFFKYFDTNNIERYVTIEDDLAAGGVKVKLEIPVKKGTITFTKFYSDDDIVELPIHLAILPFVQREDEKLDYTIALIDGRYKRNANISLGYYSKGVLIEENVQGKVRNSNSDYNDTPFLVYNFENTNFDLLLINIDNISKAAIVPNFKKIKGGVAMRYSVDFGTTNTHIEYLPENSSDESKAFDNNQEIWRSILDDTVSADPQIIANESIFDSLLLPDIIGNNEAKFPLRSALAWNKNISTNEHIQVFRDTNNFLLWGIRQLPFYQSIDLYTDIKWGNSGDIEKVKSYIDFIVHMLYYKTLVNGYNPKNSTVTWFYPVSMSRAEISRFGNAWREAFVKLFGKNRLADRLISLPESIAPYYGLKNVITGLTLSIDIGGGSSDIAVYPSNSEKPDFISSIRFAGNAMYGDAFSNEEYAIRTRFSGFANAFKQDAIDAAQKSTYKDKKLLLDNILKGNQPSKEFMNFLFQLEQDDSINFSLLELLQNDDKYKINILIYYAAVFYYAAVMMKNRNLDIPKNILFSGMASKSIRILDDSYNFNSISTLARFIFEKVFEKEAGKINVELAENPKKITAKGGLSTKVTNLEIPVLFWYNHQGAVIDKDKDVARTPRYTDIVENKDGIHESLEASVKNFFEIMDAYIDNIRLEEAYNISWDAYNTFKEIRDDNIIDDIQKAIKAFEKSANSKLDEGLFTYAIIGILNRLPREIFNKYSH